jgi:hypothetical protein
MTERETLLAEIAEKQARLAELDAEPDWEAAEKAFWMAYTQHHGTGDATKAGLIAAFAKAPPMGSVMTDAEIWTLARECSAEAIEQCSSRYRHISDHAAELAIRETLSRVQPRWPSEAELQEMAAGSAGLACTRKEVALKMALRIKAYQTGEQP